MKRVGRAAEFLAWAVFFALAAAVLVLRFWLLPEIERYREDIVAAASRAVGQPVSIGGIDADWRGLHPRINLSDVRIHDGEGREVLALPRVENMLSWRALALGRLRLHSMVIEGLRLQVRRDADGALHVAGMKLDGGGSSGFSDWVLAQQEFVLRDAAIEWLDEQRGAPPLALSALNLRLRNSGDEHALGLTAQPPASLGSTIELRALLRGRSLGELAAWSGRLYAELGYTELGAWLPWVDYPWQVDHGEGALRLWLTLQGGELKRATADVALADVTALLAHGLAPLQIASVAGRLQLGFNEGGYELAARGLALDMLDGPAIPPMHFQARWKPGAGGAFAAEALDLEPLAHLAAALPLPAEARRLLAEAGPRGRLSGLRADWSGALEAPERFTAQAGFSGLAADPSGALPGFAGISGSFETTEARGKLQLDARDAELGLPRVFPGPIALDTLNGQLEWQRLEGGGYSVRVLSVNFANDHLSGNAYGSYSRGGEGPGSVDLAAQFNRVDARHIGSYLPHGELMGSPQTRDWLVKGILAGRSEDVRFRLRGDLAEFPFRDPERGEFSVRAQLEGGVLDYARGWPRIEGIAGELLFERDRMQITGRSGSILGAALADVRVQIPRLAEGRLSVEGRAEGPTAEFLAFIEASPVRERAAGLTDAMRASGRGRLRLKLDLPLKALPKALVAGELEILDNNLVVHRDLPAIERLSGRLAFTESGLALHDVRGRLFGGPLALAGGTRRDGSVEVTAKGRATAQGARPFFDHPLAGRFSGAADYSAHLTVTKGRPRFSVESALVGMASTLPAPLAKSADEELELRLDVLPLDNGARQYAAFSLGRLARGAAMRVREDEGMKLQRAALALTPAAGARVRLPQQPGVMVYGSLPALDVDQWIAVLSKDAAGGGGSAAFNVKVGTLDVYGKRIREAALRGELGAAGWSGSIAARELAGDVSWRGADGGRLVARLTHFRMPEDYPGAAPREAIAPQDLPSVDLAAERFEYRGRPFGRVELAAQRSGGDWRIDKLTMANPDATFKASGLWRSGAPSLSALEFDLQAADAGGLLNRLGYRDLVKGGKARLQGSLSWIGTPTAIDYPSLAGQVQLEAQNGRFLEIEPGIGKLISLMSLQSLPRRITFDFRDVFSKGFEFEEITSSGQIAGGIMTLQDFHMGGSSADVSIQGKLDLARETQDLRVRVVPSLGDSASTVIAFAVNPLLAIPAAIAQKILKNPLGQIFAFNYSVTGGWAEPNVERLGVETQPVENQ